MSRKLTKVDFARIWGEVSRLSEKDWKALCALHNAQTDTNQLLKDLGTPRKTRKPKVEAGGEKP